MKKHNRRVAKENEKARIQRAINFQRRFGQTIKEFHYTDELSSRDGIHLELLVTKKASKESIDEALCIGYGSFDVVSHSVAVCPEEWLS